MSNNYVYVEDALDQEGYMAISKGVFKALAQETLEEDKYTKLAEALPFTESIEVAFEEDVLVISMFLKVKSGNQVMKVVEDIQKKIHDAIVQKTNVKDVRVNVEVVGFVF